MNSITKLDKSSGENGHCMGRACRAALRQRIRHTRQDQRRGRIADAFIEARVRDFRRILARVARTWLDEAAGMAKGAGVGVDDILMLNCLPPGFPTTPGGCTSFIRVGRTENQLFKIRDERDRIQSFAITRGPGRRRIQRANDIGNLGFAHFCAADGLAGANNTGAHTARVPDRPSLNDCHILRYFAENAATVAEVPRLYERLMDLGVAGGAAMGRGALYGFVDRQSGLLLETVSDDYVATPIRRGLLVFSNHFLSAKARQWASRPPNANTLLRKRRMEELLRRCGNRPTPQQVFAISRDRRNLPHALCNDDHKHFWMTLSAWLSVIPRDASVDAVNFTCCGNTRHSLYVPIPLSEEDTFVPMLNGAFYRATRELYRRFACNAHFRSTQRAFEAAEPSEGACAALCRQAYDLIRDNISGKSTSGRILTDSR